MKNRIQLITFSIAISLCIAIVSCKKDKAQTSDNSTKSGVIAFHLHSFVDDKEVMDYDSVYTMSNGRKISVSMAQLYLSNIQLIKLDGLVILVA